MIKKAGTQIITNLIEEKGILVTIGAHDGLSGRLGERSGFDAARGGGMGARATRRRIGCGGIAGPAGGGR